MKILLTNDDGIHAPGLRCLYRKLADSHEVWVVAPESEQSAVGHAITLQNPLRVRKVFENGSLLGFGVTGTPADCVKIGIAELLPARPDLVVSGINLGANVGINVLYSGTVSAATEGAILGVPGLAVSLATYKNPDFSLTARFVETLITAMNWTDFPTKTVLNVNVPALPKDRIRGVRFARQSTAAPIESFERRQDPRDNTYYWLSGERPTETGEEEVDTGALGADWITITPLHFDLTNHRILEGMRASGKDDPLAALGLSLSEL